MSRRSSASEPVALRPHHALCIGFFEGMGYSDAFVAHMSAVIAELQAHDPAVRLVTHCDTLCAACPHNVGGVCESAEKVLRYDEQVLTHCGFAAGTVLRWTALRQAVRDRILRRELLHAVCGDCQWAEICAAKKEDA